MKMSSKNTMLTAAVLVALTSGTTYAATPGTVDSQDLFHANRLVTDRANAPAVEERADADHYEASISRQQKDAAVRPLGTAPAKNTPQATRLRWETVDEGIAERNKEQTSFTLAAQKAQPVIITAADVKREQKLAAKEGRPPQELVGDVNLKRGPMPVAVRQEPSPVPQQAPMQTPPPQERVVPMPPPAAPAAVQEQHPPQPADAEGRPERPRYQQLPREFALNAPATSPYHRSRRSFPLWERRSRILHRRSQRTCPPRPSTPYVLTAFPHSRQQRLCRLPQRVWMGSRMRCADISLRDSSRCRYS